MEQFRDLIEASGAEKAGLIKLRDLADPTALEILNYWYDKRDGRRMPSPDDMNPVDFRRALPYMMMLQVDHDPFDITYRLIGEHIVNSHGVSFRGRSVRAVNEEKPKLGCLLFELFKAVAELRRPVGSGGEMEFAGGGYMKFEAVYMPLSFNGERTDRIMTVTCYRQVPVCERFRDELAAISASAG